MRIPLPLLRKLNARVSKTGMSQTDVVVSAIANYLDATDETPLIQRIIALEERVTALETKHAVTAEEQPHGRSQLLD